eukprot:scaffold25763_cov63-Phaeocystis_antarctica.AAC.2
MSGVGPAVGERVQSAAENALLTTAASGHYVWIGGTDAASEGTWVWSPSNTPLSYTNWNAGERNNQGGEDCVMALYGSGKWNDSPCSVPTRRDTSASRRRRRGPRPAMNHMSMAHMARIEALTEVYA